MKGRCPSLQWRTGRLDLALGGEFDLLDGGQR